MSGTSAAAATTGKSKSTTTMGKKSAAAASSSVASAGGGGSGGEVVMGRGKALQLIRMVAVDDDGGGGSGGKIKERMEVCDEGLRFLTEDLRGKKVGVLLCAGVYRSGKSFFNNRVILQNNQGGGPFTVGDTINACTMGLRISTETIRQHDSATNADYEVLVIDMEGFSAVRASEQHDAHLMAMAMMIASCLTLNVKNTISESTIVEIAKVVEITKCLRSSSSSSSSSEEAAAEQGEQKKEEKGAASAAAAAALSKCMPNLVVLVRDFALSLESENGTPISRNQYLDIALQHDPDTTDVSKNDMRSMLRTMFPQQHRACVTLSHPGVEQSKVNRLNQVSNSELPDSFVREMRDVRHSILAMTPIKRTPDDLKQPITGPMLAEFLKSLVAAFNSGGMPVIENSWAMVSQIIDRQAYDLAVVEWITFARKHRDAMMMYQQRRRRQQQQQQQQQHRNHNQQQQQQKQQEQENSTSIIVLEAQCRGLREKCLAVYDSMTTKSSVSRSSSCLEMRRKLVDGLDVEIAQLIRHQWSLLESDIAQTIGEIPPILTLLQQQQQRHESNSNNNEVVVSSGDDEAMVQRTISTTIETLLSRWCGGGNHNECGGDQKSAENDSMDIVVSDDGISSSSDDGGGKNSKSNNSGGGGGEAEVEVIRQRITGMIANYMLLPPFSAAASYSASYSASSSDAPSSAPSAAAASASAAENLPWLWQWTLPIRQSSIQQRRKHESELMELRRKHEEFQQKDRIHLDEQQQLRQRCDAAESQLMEAITSTSQRIADSEKAKAYAELQVQESADKVAEQNVLLNGLQEEILLSNANTARLEQECQQLHEVQQLLRECREECDDAQRTAQRERESAELRITEFERVSGEISRKAEESRSRMTAELTQSKRLHQQVQQQLTELQRQSQQQLSELQRQSQQQLSELQRQLSSATDARRDIELRLSRSEDVAKEERDRRLREVEEQRQLLKSAEEQRVDAVQSRLKERLELTRELEALKSRDQVREAHWQEKKRRREADDEPDEVENRRKLRTDLSAKTADVARLTGEREAMQKALDRQQAEVVRIRAQLNEEQKQRSEERHTMRMEMMKMQMASASNSTIAAAAAAAATSSSSSSPQPQQSLPTHGKL